MIDVWCPKFVLLFRDILVYTLVHCINITISGTICARLHMCALSN